MADEAEKQNENRRPSLVPRQERVESMRTAFQKSRDREAEARSKGEMKEIYAIHCHVGSCYLFEDAEGVFWLDLDGIFVRAEDGYQTQADHEDFMRKKGVPEETISRIAKQRERKDVT